MKARIVINDPQGAGWSTLEIEADDDNDLINQAAEHGYKCCGVSRSWEGCAGAHPRRELWGRPIFATLIGPMWDGGALRYEDQRAYDALST